MLNTLGKHSGKSLPTAFQHWLNTKVDAAKQCRANCRKTGLSRFRPLFIIHGENSCKSAAKFSAENATENYCLDGNGIAGGAAAGAGLFFGLSVGVLTWSVFLKLTSSPIKETIIARRECRAIINWFFATITPLASGQHR